MADLLISPRILETLAKAQIDAAEYAGAGAGALSGIGTDCWVTHGVISGPSDGGFGTVEDIRKAAGTALADASIRFAAKLRAAKQAYEGVDGELSDNLDKQMLDN
jgi:Excreted virulence factor EspC, type VII ESX diderm